MIPLSGLFLLLSGAAALTYQVVWVRLLGLSMGSTAAAVSTVLAAFFAGLAAGSGFADRLTRGQRGIRAYLLLEAGIGVSGLVLLPLLLRLDRLVASLPVAIASALATKFLLTVALLAIPTMCMGATFPVMADLVARGRSDVGGRLSFVYSLNTWGAVAGALLAGFVLIPRFGLDGAVVVAAGANFTIVAIGLLSRRAFDGLGDTAQPADAARFGAPAEPHGPAARAALLALVTTGFCSIAAEVGWTKYLAVFTGATLYGFATILAVFLSGIALGSWLVRPLLGGSPDRAVRLLASGLVLLALAVAATRPALRYAPTVLEAVSSDGSRALYAYAFIVAALAPPTLLLGALFPMSLELYCGAGGALRRRAGRAYAMNTLAGIAGSIAAGFLIIPRAGTDTLLLGLALAFALVAALIALIASKARPRAMIVAASAVVAMIAVALPALDYHSLVRAVTMRDPSAAGSDPSLWRFEYLREAHAGVVSVLTRDGVRGALQTNGLTESYLNFVDPMQGSATESLLGLVPYLLHREPSRAFVVGFGGGNTAFALTRTRELETIRVVELEPAIVEAVRTVTHDFVPALIDPRVRLELNDARNALLVDETRYDIIVSQPSHPWLAGSGTLFTRQFFEMVRSRLGPGGVFGQWVNLFNMDAVTLGAILKSFYEVFPYGFSLRPAGGADLLIFGSEWPLVLDPARIDQRLAHRELGEHLARLDIKSATDLLRDFALSRTETLRAVQAGPANTDTNLISEVRLARIGGGPLEGRDAATFLAETRGFDLGPYLPPAATAALLAELATDLDARGRAAEAAIVRTRLQERPTRE